MAPLFRSSIVREVMTDSSQLQALAQLGADAEREAPVFPGGLVTSPDGLLWLPGSRETTATTAARMAGARPPA